MNTATLDIAAFASILLLCASAYAVMRRSLAPIANGLFASTLVIVPLAPVQAQSCSIKIQAADSYRPFSYINKTGAYDGIDVQLVTRVLQSVGCQPEFIDIPFPRGLSELSKGGIDMMMFASKTAEREQYAHFSHAYRNETAGFIIRSEDRGAYDIKSVDDIASLNLFISYEPKNYYGKAFRAFAKKPGSRKHLIEIDSGDESLRMLMNKRINMIVDIPEAILLTAEQQGIADQVEAHPFLLLRDPVYFMFSRITIEDAFVSKVNSALAKELETAEYREAFGTMSLSVEENEEPLSN